MSSQTDPVPTPESAPDVPTKKYDEMTSEERAEYDRLQREREEEEQASKCYATCPISSIDHDTVLVVNHPSRIAGCIL